MTNCSGVSIVDYEQVNTGWVARSYSTFTYTYSASLNNKIQQENALIMLAGAVQRAQLHSKVTTTPNAFAKNKDNISVSNKSNSWK